MLKEHGGVLGGETSGHLLCLDRTTTVTFDQRLEVLAVMKRTGRPLAELVAGMPKFPQVMINVRVKERIDPSQSRDPGAVRRVEDALGSTGRWSCARPARSRDSRHDRGRDERSLPGTQRNWRKSCAPPSEPRTSALL